MTFFTVVHSPNTHYILKSMFLSYLIITRFIRTVVKLHLLICLFMYTFIYKIESENDRKFVFPGPA